MTDVVKFINDAIDAWYESGQKISTKGFVLKKAQLINNLRDLI